jgi:Zn-dependent protease with chaperone function
MNNIVSAFAKICACTAVLIGAPLIAASAVDFTTSQINRDLEYRACLVTAKLDNASTDRCIR